MNRPVRQENDPDLRRWRENEYRGDRIDVEEELLLVREKLLAVKRDLDRHCESCGYGGCCFSDCVMLPIRLQFYPPASPTTLLVIKRKELSDGKLSQAN